MPGPTEYHSKNFVWFGSDVLGTGATGSVYYCRHKRTGELFAVKTFSRTSEMRPLEVQMREFEVLQKLDHPNIVRLMAVEEDQSTRRKVIIMELCNGGSLHSILDDPNSGYGLEQSDFIVFLEHITSGMQHLREQQVVHRDIKPGNILRHTTEDGSFVYKLTDFGAARELEEADSQFMSIYGTEEYLHPYVYERGVLRQSTGKKFSAEIDLWSVGATIYHAATGHLPFRPYGGRKNKLTMHQMITQKGTGVIAGVQHYENGPIEWQSELPETCLLSRSLRQELTWLLQGLLEIKEEHCWSFDKFFSEALKLCRKIVIHVFDVWAGRLVDIHLDPSACFATFQECVAVFTDIPASDQLLLYRNQEFDRLVSDLAQSSTYPQTSPHSPVFLYRRNGRHPFPPLKLPEIPKFPPIPERVSGEGAGRYPGPGEKGTPEEVYHVTKESCSHLHYMLRCVERSGLEQTLMTEAVEQYSHLLTRHIERVRDHALHFQQTATETCARVLHAQAVCQADQSIIQRAGGVGCSERDLKDIVGDRTPLIQEFGDKVKQVCQRCESDYNKYVLTRHLTARWSPQHACAERDRCVNKVRYCVNEVTEILGEMAQLKRLKRTGHDDFKFPLNKARLKENCNKALQLMEGHCFLNQKQCHEKMAEWFRYVCEIEAGVKGLETRLNQLVEEQQELSVTQSSIEMAYLAQWRDWTPAPRPQGSPGAPAGAPDSSNVVSLRKLTQELEEFQADHARMIVTATKNLEMLNFLENVADNLKLDV